MQKQLQTNSAEPEFEKSTNKSPKKKFNDPLMEWPVRGMAFTNDIGAAIMDIAPTAGKLFWVPALMYFGADIYDKYRNNKAEYDPSAKRGFKQAIFQALASVVFPIAVVHAGQKTASLLNRFSKEGISLQSKEEVIRHQLHHMSQIKLKDYENNVDAYKKDYNAALDTYIEESIRKYKYKNPFKILTNLIFGHRHPEKLDDKQKGKIYNYINKRIDNMFAMRQELLEGKKPAKMSEKMFTTFLDLKETYKNDSKYADNFDVHAAKDVLKKLEENKIFKTKLAKTIGGFVALGLLIKPMDSFVENVIMHKFVGPGLDKIDKSQILNFKKNFLNN